MTTLVYIYAAEQSDEFRYSLRAACACFDVERVIVIGDMPDWLVDAEHIGGNGLANRAENVHGNIRIAATHPATPERFVMMHDDYFPLRPYTPKLENCGRTLSEHWQSISKPGAAALFHPLGQTDVWLQFSGIDAPVSFETHSPWPVEKSILADVMDKCAQVRGMFPIQARSAYGNLSGLPSTDGFDHKIRGGNDPVGWSDWDCVSTQESTFADHPVGRMIRDRFDWPSDFERAS